jgi:hypothetical protein
VGAGNNLLVHDPAPPSNVGFTVNSVCSGPAVAEQVSSGGKVGSFARGQGQVNLSFPRGRNQYRVRCIGDDGPEDAVAAEGTITVLHDAGTAQLPRSAPATRVDTDGRTYTVLYQNLLPKISVRWPDAPKASSYSVRVSSPGGRNVTLASGGPRYNFTMGQFGEGQHTVTFSGAGTSSPPTNVLIRFDNAAPTASIRSPENGSFGRGASVNVSGVALAGWEVAVGGKVLPMDAQHRFSGQAQVPTGLRAIAIRFSHPHRGTHFYLRRTGGS